MDDESPELKHIILLFEQVGNVEKAVKEAARKQCGVFVFSFMLLGCLLLFLCVEWMWWHGAFAPRFPKPDGCG